MAEFDPKILKGIDIFGPLSEVAIEQILTAPENAVESYAAKDFIMREQEEGENMYVVLTGSVEVLIRGGASGRQVSNEREIPISTLHEGDFFGEQALLPGGYGKRNASVRAITDCKLFRLHKKYVDLHVNRDLDLTMTQITMLELPQDKEVREILESMRLFQKLGEKEIRDFRQWTEIIEVMPHELVFREREPAENMYIVLEGELEVFIKSEASKETVLVVLKQGNYFGELALLDLTRGKRNASVRAKRRSRLIKIPKKYFRLSLKRDPSLVKAMQTINKAQKARLKAAKKQ